MQDYDFDSDAQLMVISDRHNKQDLDLETLEKQLNTQNIVSNLHLNQVVSVTEFETVIEDLKEPTLLQSPTKTEEKQDQGTSNSYRRNRAKKVRVSQISLDDMTPTREPVQAQDQSAKTN